MYVCTRIPSDREAKPKKMRVTEGEANPYTRSIAKYGNTQNSGNVPFFEDFVHREPNDTTRCSAAATEWGRMKTIR